MTTCDLPPALLAAIEGFLENRSRCDLAERSARITATYRRGGGSRGVVKTDADVLAYAVARMPATYAAAIRVCAEAASRLPDFEPRTVLDVGAGPGTAGFAAAQTWPIEALTQLDHNPAFLRAARDFGLGFDEFALRESRQIEADLARLSRMEERFDLVTAAYVLAETALPAAAALAESFWARCGGVLVLVEPGTPGGYARIIAARARLIALGARIVAPCPHENPCPLAPPDWCHFAERLARRRAHIAAKAAAAPFEDEKFSYLVAASASIARAPAAARLIDRPDAGKAGLRLKLCRTDGSAGVDTIARRDRERFAAARRLRWGDTLDRADEPPDGF